MTENKLGVAEFGALMTGAVDVETEQAGLDLDAIEARDAASGR